MRTVGTRPPALGRLLLQLRRLGDRRTDVEADLQELFRARLARRERAAWRYYRDVISLWIGWQPPARMTRPPRRGGRERMQAMRQDLLYALRVFRRQPGLFGLTVAGLALAMAISTSVFSIVNALTVRDAGGIVQPESVVRLALSGALTTSAAGGATYTGSWPRAGYAAFASVAASDHVAAVAYHVGQVALTPGPAGVPQGQVKVITGTFFPLLGGRAVIGRTLQPGDDRPGAPPVAVLGYSFWTLRAGGDPNVVGRQVFLDGVPLTVVGVSERRFVGPGFDLVPPAVWVPFATADAVWGLKHGASEPWNPFVDVVARIDASRTAPQLAAQATSIVTSRLPPADLNARPSVQAESADQRTNSSDGAMLMMLLGLVIVGLGAANVANLLLASAAGRRHEIGTRLAIGATRGRVARQLLTESVLLAIVAGGLGVVTAYWLAPVLASFLKVPMVDVSPDPRVYAFVSAVAGVAGILAGLAPLRLIRKGDLLTGLKPDRLSVSPAARPSRRVRALLLGVQAAVSVVLVVVAALLTRATIRATTLDLGLEADRLINLRALLPRGTDDAQAAAYWHAAMDRASRFPGVSGVSLALAAPFDGNTAQIRTTSGRVVQRNETSATFFATTGIRVLRGRIYTDEEARARAPVAVISARVAQEFWGDADPLGATLERVWGPDDPKGPDQPGFLRKPLGTRVIGVVAEAVISLRRHDAPRIYLPIAPANLSNARMVVAAHSDPGVLVAALKDALRGVDPEVEIRSTLVRERLDEERSAPRSLAAFAILLSGTALSLACIGLFGVTAFAVVQRRHEVSIRMALGAGVRQVLVLVMRENLVPVLAGLAVGVVAALLAGQIVSSFLYGISARDPIALVSAVVVLLVAALAATFLPARRAAHVDPLQSLKTP